MLEIVDFRCNDDLTQFTDSMLFDDSTDIACLELTDGKHRISMEIAVVGEVAVRMFGSDEPYSSEITDEIKEVIKKGDYDSLDVLANNWFEGICHIEDEKGNEIFSNGDVFESDISKMTPDELKSVLFDWSNDFYKEACERDIVNKKTEFEL